MDKDLRIIHNKDVTFDILKNMKIGVVGYGNQGKAQALNLKDRGLDLKIGLRSNSKSLAIALSDGFVCESIESVVEWADLIALLVPDKEMPIIYKNSIKDFLSAGKTLLFSHGFNVHYNLIDIPEKVNVVMVAPSGGGAVVRKQFLNNSGVPSLIAVEKNYSGDAFDIVKGYSKAIGCTRICSFMSTFKEETETDLFGEQVLLTGSIPRIIEMSLKVLLEAGYSPTVAWFVCYYEIKTIVDLFHEKGFDYLYEAISDTARYGGISRGNYLIDENIENKIKNVLKDIQDGTFTNELQSLDSSIEYKNTLSESDQNNIKKIFKSVFNK